MIQTLSLEEISSFGKIQSLSNIAVIVLAQNGEIKYINSPGQSWLDVKNAVLSKSKINLHKLLIDESPYKWEQIEIDIENEILSLFTKSQHTQNPEFNNKIHLNKMIEDFPELIYWKDSDLIYQGCNKNAANLLGYKTPADIIGKSDTVLAKEFHWTEDKLKNLHKTDKIIIEQGICVAKEERIVGYNDTKTYLTSKKPLYNNEKIIGILAISTDITNRKIIEEELKNSKEKNEIYLNGIIENLPQLVYWKDDNLIYQGCNKFCADILNLKNPADIIGKSDNDFGWTEQRIKELHEIDNAVLKHGTASTVEDIIPVDNTYKTFLTSKSPLLDKNNKIVGILGISTNITDRIKMEEELRSAKIAAEAGERAKAAFIANMSHDLRTPLTGVIGEAYLLKGNVTDSQRIQYADELAKSGEILLKMYNDIIEDIKSDRMSDTDVETNTFDLNKLFIELKDTVQPTFTWKNLVLNIAIDPNIPNFLVSDQRKIYRIIENLVGNAMKFTDKGSIELKVDLLEQQKYTTKIKINVIDTGIGIPDNSKSKLFERFYKVSPSYKGEYEGFGLGLNIAKNYTTLLNGTIGFESTEGIGSNFYVILTLKIATEEEIAAYKTKASEPKRSLLKTPTPETPQPTTASDKDSAPVATGTSDAPHVLVIEDNLVARTITVMLVKQANLNVTEAHDGKTALELAKNKEFDLILADVGLPDISGIEFTQQLRQFEKEQGKKPVTIIGVTAHAADGRKECTDAGMDEALPKPFTADMLDEIITVYLPTFKAQKKTT